MKVLNKKLQNYLEKRIEEFPQNFDALILVDRLHHHLLLFQH